MNRDLKNAKLYKLLMDTPSNIVLTSSYLRSWGLTNANVKKYLHEAILTSLARGAYKKASDNVDWSGVVYGLQQSKEGRYHIGGIVALRLSNMAHLIKSESEQKIYLYSGANKKLPLWLVKNRWGFEINFIHTNFLSLDTGLDDFDYGGYKIKISTRERAILEVIHDMDKFSSFYEVNLLMANSGTLDSDLIQKLLEECISVRTIRIFLFLAKKNQLGWLNSIKIDKLHLGSGKRQLVEGGFYDPEFQITYPKDLFESKKFEF
ncbi:MAG: type IV toxin-antitoxin system AbiEi family antitoxin domain-containing protein [Rickettsiaceae bacterium]|nr:type IV toxin-antitoxin system AbiEi family antitoxin domain-containing protein [Rickettsiaceae bacterium]